MFTEARHKALRNAHLMLMHRKTVAGGALPRTFEERIENDEWLKAIVNGVEGSLRLFFITAVNWENWEYYGAIRAGMRLLAAKIDQEHFCAEPATPDLDYAMDTINRQDGHIWMPIILGRVEAYGDIYTVIRTQEGDEPVDVEWTLEDIEACERSFKEDRR
jgi:hypothetical protein